MSHQQQVLERAAIDAHRAGIGWSAFWDRHGEAIRQVVPYDRRRRRRLVNRLLHLLVSGDPSGQKPAGDTMPWERDNQPEPPSPHDTETQARCQLPLWPLATPEIRVARR